MQVSPDGHNGIAVQLAEEVGADLTGMQDAWWMPGVQLPGEELKDVNLRAGDAFRIVPGTIHYMEAVTDCDVLEASTPELDDVIRVEDDFGREGTTAP